MSLSHILSELEALRNPAAIAQANRLAITPSIPYYGVSLPRLRELAKAYKKDHPLALELWAAKIHETRILATVIDDYRQVSAAQMDTWAADFETWDLCDQACMNLFWRTPFAYEKVPLWCAQESEFIRRAGFSLMVGIAIHDKKAPDEKITPFLPLIEGAAQDERNFVKKAVNWALRQIGKRNLALNALATQAAERIAAQGGKTATWIAKDALKEIQDPALLTRLQTGAKRKPQPKA